MQPNLSAGTFTEKSTCLTSLYLPSPKNRPYLTSHTITENATLLVLTAKMQFDLLYFALIENATHRTSPKLT